MQEMWINHCPSHNLTHFIKMRVMVSFLSNFQLSAEYRQLGILEIGICLGLPIKYIPPLWDMISSEIQRTSYNQGYSI